MEPRGRVLIVDDDLLVGRGLARLLRQHHDVALATDGNEAIALLQSGQRFDLILCDVMMPNMTGVGLRRVLKELVPDQVSKLVFITGNPSHWLSEALTGHLVLEKPVDSKSIIALVSRVVSASVAGYFPLAGDKP